MVKQRHTKNKKKQYAGYKYKKVKNYSFECFNCGKRTLEIFQMNRANMFSVEKAYFWLCPSCIESLVEKGVLW